MEIYKVNKRYFTIIFSLTIFIAIRTCKWLLLILEWCLIGNEFEFGEWVMHLNSDWLVTHLNSFPVIVSFQWIIAVIWGNKSYPGIQTITSEGSVILHWSANRRVLDAIPAVGPDTLRTDTVSILCNKCTSFPDITGRPLYPQVQHALLSHSFTIFPKSILKIDFLSKSIPHLGTKTNFIFDLLNGSSALEIWY